MKTDYNDQNSEEELKYQNQDARDTSKIDDVDMLKRKAAEQMAKIQEQKKELAEKLQKMMEDVKKQSVPFKKEVVNKFENSIVGMIVMPPKPSQKSLESKTGDIEEKPNVFVIMEFSDTKDLQDLLRRFYLHVF